MNEKADGDGYNTSARCFLARTPIKRKWEPPEKAFKYAAAPTWHAEVRVFDVLHGPLGQVV